MVDTDSINNKVTKETAVSHIATVTCSPTATNHFGLPQVAATIQFQPGSIPSPRPSPGPAPSGSGISPQGLVLPHHIPSPLGRVGTGIIQGCSSPLGIAPLSGSLLTTSPDPSASLATTPSEPSALASQHPYHPSAANSFSQLNKLASEKQNTLAGTLGHTPPSPIVIQPSQPGTTCPQSYPATSTPPTSAAISAPNMNGPLTPQTLPNPGPITNPMSTSNGQDVQNNNTVKAKSCAGCGARICDRFLLHAMDRYWHTGCLKCSCCQAQLGEIGTTCYAKAGMILCKNDYIRLFGSSGTCSACGQSIPASEFVMRAQTNVYHLNCFTCVACNSRLVPGDRYSLFNGSLICEHDYPKVLKGHTQIPLRASHKVC